MQRIGYHILGIDRYSNWLVGLNKLIDHKEQLVASIARQPRSEFE